MTLKLDGTGSITGIDQGLSVTGIGTFDSVIIPDSSTEIKIWTGNKVYSGSTTNIAIGGTGTLMLNTQGNSNVAIGNEAMVHNTSGDDNVSIGYAAGSNITTGDKNVAVGAYAIGYWGTYTGNNNTAVGSESLLGLSTGDDNTAVGQGAGTGIAEGDDNVAIGSNSLRDCLSGNGNIAIGYRAGKGIYDGSNNIIIGNNKAQNTLPDDLSSTVIVSCGVTERLRINSAGNVGIGSDNPGTRLNVAGEEPIIRLSDTDTALSNGELSSAIEFAQNDVSDPNSVNASIRAIGAGSTGNLALTFHTGQDTERVRIGASGQIGLSGANYGTNNQVITSTGTGSAPVWRGVNASFYGYQGTAHNVANTTWTIVKNLGGTGNPPPVSTTGWDHTTGLFTANADTAGTWYIFGCAGIDDVQSLDVVYMGIMINGANPSVYTHSRMYSGATNSIMGGGMVAAVVTLADGDTVGVGVYHNEGTTQPTEQNRCFAGGFRLSV